MGVVKFIRVTRVVCFFSPPKRCTRSDCSVGKNIRQMDRVQRNKAGGAGIVQRLGGVENFPRGSNLAVKSAAVLGLVEGRFIRRKKEQKDGKVQSRQRCVKV